MACASLVAIACVARPTVIRSAPSAPAERPAARPAERPVAPASNRPIGEQLIRVELANDAAAVRVASSGDWRFVDGSGGLIARADPGSSWRIQRDGVRVRAVRPDGVPTVWVTAPIVASSDDDTRQLSLNNRHYRGELVIYPGDTGFVVVNRLPVDEYLKGVVPEEIGHRPAEDSAAVEAQAISARSYAAIHLGDSGRYDLTAGTLDQVYGGIDAETPVGSAAVESTRGLVLMYGGHVVNAPYHSTCGGSTAEANEVWHTPGEPYLQRVSDQIPGTDRYYCDISPRFRWTRTLDAATLNAAIARYLKAYVAVPGGNPGVVRDVDVNTRTPSGRVGVLHIATDRGNFLLRGNDIRYVLRAPGGEILSSTYFSVEAETGNDGSIAKLTLRGQGNGHGVGMCQWGAIGRARAGQDFRTILRTYYPGTTIGSM